MKRWLYVLAALVGVLGFLDIYFALIWSPSEVWMGDIVRIMYFHVASAWLAFLAYFVAFIFAVLYLVRGTSRWDLLSLSSVDIGMAYTTITLISGSIWGRSVWNTWWTWDPRLTTTLILWFLFLGYLLLRGTIDGVERRAKVSSVYAIVAFIDVPVIHMSVTWWRSIHPNIITDQGFNMPGSMVFTLVFGFLVFMGLYAVLLWLRVRQESQGTQINELRRWIRDVRAHAEGRVEA